MPKTSEGVSLLLPEARCILTRKHSMAASLSDFWLGTEQVSGDRNSTYPRVSNHSHIQEVYRSAYIAC